MDGAAVVFRCECDDLSGKLVVDVPHDSGFLVVDGSDGIDLFLIAQLAAEFFILPSEILVLPAVAEELGLAVGQRMPRSTPRMTSPTNSLSSVRTEICAIQWKPFFVIRKVPNLEPESNANNSSE